MKGWNEVTSQIIHAKVEVGVNNYRIVCAYRPGIEETREKMEVIWFEFGELSAGCESGKVVCLMKLEHTGWR